jgi:Ca-activated chloride channel family protein
MTRRVLFKPLLQKLMVVVTKKSKTMKLQLNIAKSKWKHTPVFWLSICFAVLLPTAPAMASDDPDKLYRQGRFAEAERAYAEADMNRPKDIRYRYNRGCAAYQNSDYKASEAAFSSVLRRTEDEETRFKAAFNLGNTAFKQGDLHSAANHYKQALLYKPDSNDAMHNLELALREMKKQEEKQQKGTDSKGENQPNSSQNQEGQEKQKQDTSTDEGSTDSEKETPENKGQRDPKDPSESEQEDKRSQPAPPDNATGKNKEQSPQDLSGELEPREPMPEKSNDNENQGLAPSMIDRKKAEALLDNIQEDPSRVFQYQIPQEKRHGVSSGKDW